MKNQLIPPPGMEPRQSKELTSEQWIQVWMDLYDVGEQFLLAGLRQQIGPEGDLQAAYREWHTKYMEDHDQALIRMMRRLNCPGATDGR